MSYGKRLHYSEESTSESSNTESDCEYNPSKVLKTSNGTSVRRPTRQPKSFSRNALMARENRLKKKLYVENMEKQLQTAKGLLRKKENVMKEQTMVIEKQEKELKYLRSVLANSNDISRLLRSIHTNTGMCAATSLNKNGFKDSPSPNSNEIHPWFETPTYENDFNLASDFDFSPVIEDNLPDNYLEFGSPKSTMLDHNYTLSTADENEDVGVCLHISKHKVALEFCASCNENANEAWMRKESPI